MFEDLLEGVSPLPALNKDVKAAAKLISPEEVKYLVKLYYKMQKSRIMSSNAMNAFQKLEKPNTLVTFIADQQKMLEDQVKVLLTTYSKFNMVSKWAQSNKGIGPVISAGLNAYINMDRAPTPGHILSYGGYNPKIKWEKGQPIPYNKDLKLLFFKIGDSFVKVKSRDKAYYGQLYAARKAFELKKNEEGAFRKTAEEELATKTYSKDTEAYKAYIQGKLPLARIEMRARRHAVIFFISHWHTVATFERYGNIANRLYAFDILGHSHYVAPDNMDMLPGLREALVNKYNGIIPIEKSLEYFMRAYGVTERDIKKVKEEPDPELDETSDN